MAEHEPHEQDRTAPSQGPSQAQAAELPAWAEPPLRRPHEGRIVGGVAAGIARYLGVDVAVIRIAVVVLAMLGGIGIPAYLAAWVLIPDECAEESVAEEWLARHGHAA